MRNKTVHLLALFLVMYIGVEVTIGGIYIKYLFQPYFVAQQIFFVTTFKGWIVTFLMLVRDGGPSSGYVSTGFFGGKYLIINPLFSLCVEHTFFSN